MHFADNNTFSHSLTDLTQTNNTAQKVGTKPLIQNAQIILRILTHSLLIKYLENYRKLDCNGLILCMYNREVSYWKAPQCNNPVKKNKCETRWNVCQFHTICFADF